MKRYTTREAAELLGYSYQYFMGLLRAGLIQYHKMSARRYFLTEEDIKASVDAGLVPVQKKGLDREAR